MQEAQIENAPTAADASSGPAQELRREISSIQFPYGDLDDAVEFAKAVHEVGGQSCLIEQVAGHLKVAPKGGAFQARLAYPRIFGLTKVEKGVIKLTPLGMRAVDTTQETDARVEAFLTVPLYKTIFDKYKGYTLPPRAALEREMGMLGVSSKQTDKARQVFERSAKQAGFYWAGIDRLTLPVSKPESRPIDPPAYVAASALGGGGGNGGGHHPFIEGLLKTLPPVGQDWPVRDRAKWLRLAANAFDVLYKGEGEIEIKVATHRNDDVAA